MSITTKIQWCDSTVNPTMGCEGCELWNPQTGVRRCYAGVLHARFGKATKGYSPTFDELTFWPGRMAEAARWPNLTDRVRPTKPWLGGAPRLVFVSDMSDALSEAVSFDFLESEVITVVTSTAGRQHRWLWLTKRPERMARLSEHLRAMGTDWPTNLWVGTSITTQATTARIRSLLRVGSDDTTRFLSVEPQHEQLDLTPWLPSLDWVIQGGESGRCARPFHVEWAVALLSQCLSAGVSYFLKQLGANVFRDGRQLTLADGHGGDWAEWPQGVKVREIPEVEQQLPSTSASVSAETGGRVSLSTVSVENKGRQIALKAWATRRENERKRRDAIM